MNTHKQLLALIVAAIAFTATRDASAASIVSAIISQDGTTVAHNIYTGPDGGASSDPATYWSLLGSSPEITSDVTIKPDEPKGQTATLNGPVEISVIIRNRICMGIIQLKGLTLVRDGTNSDAWYLPDNEFRRVSRLVKHELKPTVTVSYTKRYRTIGKMVYVAPSDKKESNRASSHWALLGKAPTLVFSSNIKPDEPNGKTATLKGDLELSLTPRPFVDIQRRVATESLQLVRDDTRSQRWYLPAAEQKRIAALATKLDKDAQ